MVLTLQLNLHDTSTIGDEKGNTSSTIAARGCSHGRAYDHKNKALPGDSPDCYHLFIYLFSFNKKQEHVVGHSFSLDIFWSLTNSGGDQRE